MKNRLSNKLLSFFTFFFLFEYAIMFAISYYIPFFSNTNIFKLFQIIASFLSGVLFLYSMSISKKISVRSFLIFIFLIIFIIGYFLTGLLLGYDKSYITYRYYLFLTLLPSFFCGYYLWTKGIVSFVKDSWIYALILLVALIGAFFTTKIVGGNAKDYNYEGFSYQSLSYYVVYLGSFLLTRELLKKEKRTYCFYGVILIFIISFLVSLSIGGRGALVYSIIYTAFLLFFLNKISIIKIKQNFSNPSSLLFFVIVFVTINVFLNNGRFSIGVSRIFELQSNFKNDDRLIIYLNAINRFKESPAVGYGIGSVFHVNGIYSHNIFIDVLVETGTIGVLCIVLILVFAIQSYLRQIRYMPENHLVFNIFLMGFVMSMFSGYYITNSLFLTGLSYFLFSYNRRGATCRV